MAIQAPDVTISEWKSAYRKANNKHHAPFVSYGMGWFRIKGSKTAIREKDMLAMTDDLNRRIAQNGENQ